MSAIPYHSPTNSGWLKKFKHRYILIRVSKFPSYNKWSFSKGKDHSYKLKWKCKPRKYANRNRVNLQNKIDRAKFILSNGFLICHVLDDK
jgi:hypothetical protein